MGLLDGLIGAILVATIVSTSLFGILTVQTQSYFSRFPNDPRWLKVMVGVLWVVDFAHQVCTCMISYEYTIRHFHDPSYLLRNIRPMSTAVTLEPIPAVIVQFYFARRLYLLNSKWWPVVSLTIVLALCAFGFGGACGVIIHLLPFLGDFKRYTWLVTAWLTTCCVCDVVISSAIAYQLWTSRSGFKPTDKLLAKLAVWTVNTGMVPAVIALLDMITFICLNDSLVHLGANIVLAKLYSNSMLAFLNRRRSEKQIHFHHVSGAGDINMSTFTSATTKSFNITPRPNLRNAMENPVRFEVSTQQFIDPEPEDDYMQRSIEPPGEKLSQSHGTLEINVLRHEKIPNTASSVHPRWDFDITAAPP